MTMITGLGVGATALLLELQTSGSCLIVGTIAVQALPGQQVPMPVSCGRDAGRGRDLALLGGIVTHEAGPENGRGRIRAVTAREAHHRTTTGRSGGVWSPLREVSRPDRNMNTVHGAYGAAFLFFFLALRRITCSFRANTVI